MTALFIGIGVALGVLVGYLAGRARRRADAPKQGRRLDEYDFYPFVVSDSGHVEFSADAFDEAVRHFLEHRNDVAARELIVIGEQNLVRDTFTTDRLQRYKDLYEEYGGDDVVSDNDAFLENYRRIVNQIGRSFSHTGIEILLHNLVNPSRSLVAIEGGEVTGRSIGSGATNLVLDLKTRRQRGEDKVNYELNIGSRQFKCTTIPIFRPEYGLVGAICINVDTHFIRDSVLGSDERLQAFIDNLLRTDFQLDENILSRDEYQNALRGKRHFLDEAIRAGSGTGRDRHLAALMFSDIVDFTALMGQDEKATLSIIEHNDRIHRQAIAAHRGRLLKRLGDGILASFGSASEAVACAQEVRRGVHDDGRYDVRIGIHLGEVIESEGDVHGDGVNIASRILSEVDPGEIGITGVVYENIRNKPDVDVIPRGERKLKNVSAPIQLYTVGA